MKLIDTYQGKEFKRPTPGTHPGVCTAIIDLGSHESEYMGTAKVNRKIRILWETAEKMDDGRNFQVQADFNFSTYKDSKLIQLLNGWRGVPFTPEDLKDGFDFHKLLGKGCVLSLIETVGKDGKTYTNVVTVSAPMKGMEIPKPNATPFLFSLSEPDWNLFENLTQNVRNKIMLSPEYKSLKGEGKAADEEFSPEDEDTLAF
jgi:hypothetical protein